MNNINTGTDDVLLINKTVSNEQTSKTGWCSTFWSLYRKTVTSCNKHRESIIEIPDSNMSVFIETSYGRARLILCTLWPQSL